MRANTVIDRMAYSRRRLAAVAVFFFLLALGFQMVPPGHPLLDNGASDGVVRADNHNCMDSGANDTPPCMFPVEAGNGGFVMGASTLGGQDFASWLTTNGGNDGTDSTCYDDTTIDCIYRPTAPGRVDDPVTVVGVGLNNIDATEFYTYKAWRSTHHTGQTFHTYFWMSADSAGVKGTSACPAGSDGNGTLAYGIKQCDLVTLVGESAMKDFWAEADTSLGTQTLTASDYWLSQPERDQCNVNIWDTSAACLGMMESASDDQSKLSNTVMEFAMPELRVHHALAQPDDINTDPPTSKELDMVNVYLGLRIGKGTDMAYVPENGTYPNNGEPLLNGARQSRRTRWSNNYACNGNPMGTGYEACAVDSANVGVQGTLYEDVHRP